MVYLFEIEQKQLWINTPEEKAVSSNSTKKPAVEQLSLWAEHLKRAGISLDTYQSGYLSGLPELPGYRAAAGRPLNYKEKPKSPIETPYVIALPGAQETESRRLRFRRK